MMLETQNNKLAACRCYQHYGFILGGIDRLLYRAEPEIADHEIALFWYLPFNSRNRLLIYRPPLRLCLLFNPYHRMRTVITDSDKPATPREGRMNQNKVVLLMLAIAMSGCAERPPPVSPTNAADRRHRFAAGCATADGRQHPQQAA